MIHLCTCNIRSILIINMHYEDRFTATVIIPFMTLILNEWQSLRSISLPSEYIIN